MKDNFAVNKLSVGVINMEKTTENDDLVSDNVDDSDEDVVTCYLTEKEKDNSNKPSGKEKEENGMPRILFKKKMVLEENLNRLQILHDGIEKIRQMNLERTSDKKELKRLSWSCPSLVDDQVDNYSVANDLRDYRNKEWCEEMAGDCDEKWWRKRADSLEVGVKIHINGMTPTASQECLATNLATNLATAAQSPHHPDQHPDPDHRGNVDSISNRQSLGQTYLGNLEPEEGPNGRQRRRSWSSTDQDEEKSKIKKNIFKNQRSMSLSSLDSEADETFFDARSEATEKCEMVANVNCNDNRWEKQRSLSGSSSPLHAIVSSGECASYHSLNDYSIQDKREKKKVQKGNYACSPTLMAPRLPTLQKSVSTPSIIAVKDAVVEQNFSAAVIGNVSYAAQNQDSDQEQTSKRKKRGGSIFSRKKRGKDKEKDFRKSSHHFVPVCYSNSTVCDVCSKSMANKPALHCETCLVNVHEYSCKDQILDCSRLKIFHKGASKHMVINNSPLINISRHSSYTCQSTGPLVVVSSTVSPPLNAKKNANGGKSNQMNCAVGSNSKTSSSTSNSSGRSYIPCGYSQWRRVATKLGVNKVINEERESDAVDEVILQTNMTELNSTSMESLDEDAVSTGNDAVDFNDVDDDPGLGLLIEEPEAWSSNVDKKTLKKMKDKDIKRQENIYELIITEKHHCLTLKIMQKVFAQGMLNELQMPPEVVEKIFPQLDELIELHLSFLNKLRERQRQSFTVENIGDIVSQQFRGKQGDRMKLVYGEFCSRHTDAVSLYKDIFKSDRKFQSFIKKISLNPACKTRGIPECILLVTQRLTKYPLLIEAMMKTLKDSNKVEHMNLAEANVLVKEVLSSVNAQVAEREREQRLLEMYNKIDAKSATAYRGKKFKKSDLLSNNRKLRFEGPVRLNQARGKFLEVTAVVLSDVIFFLQENNQKYSFVTQDNKAGVISLQKLYVREKAGLDSTGIFLISTNPSDPEMYELICPSRKDKKIWIEMIHSAAKMCPEEDEGIPSEGEEERKLYEARVARVRQLESALHDRDHKLAAICEEKMKIFTEMMDLACKEETSAETFKYVPLIDEMEEGPETRELLLIALQEATRLASSLYSEGTNLSRSVSSAGEHQSEAYVSPILPRRAETFGGFDNQNKDAVTAVPKASGLKKKFHLLKDAEGRAASLLNLAVKCENDNSPVDTSDPFLHVKVKEVRRASGPLPSRDSLNPDSPDQSLVTSRRSTFSSSLLLTSDYRQDKNLLSVVEPKPLGERDTVGELVNLSSTPPLLTIGKEKWAAAIQLSHYLNTLMCLFSQHFTNVESLRTQLSMANEQMAKLSKDTGRDRDKRHVYKHNQQLEELRNLQEQLSEEKSTWQRDLDAQKERLEKERQQVQRQQEQMKQDQADIANQRDQLYRYLEVLQRHGITLSPNMAIVGSLSTEDNANQSQVDASPSAHGRNASIDSKDATVIVAPSSTSTSSCSSSSCNSRNSPPQSSGEVKRISKGDGTKGRTNSSASLVGKRDSFPLNLCSATNQQKVSSTTTVRQQLPLKLASKENQVTAVSKGSTHSLPSRLSSSCSSTSSSSSSSSSWSGGNQPPAQAINSTFVNRCSDKRNDEKAVRVKDAESNQEIFFF